MAEAKYIVVERDGAFVIGWKSNVRSSSDKLTIGLDGGEPIYMVGEHALRFPSREDAERAADVAWPEDLKNSYLQLLAGVV